MPPVGQYLVDAPNGVRDQGDGDVHRVALEHAPVVAVSIDLTGTCTSADGAALELLGRVGADLIGCPFLSLCDVRHPEVAAALRRALEGETLTAPIDDMFGLEFDAWYAPLRGPFSEVTGAMIVATDVTARRQAERELAGREAHFRALLEHSSDMTVVVGRGGEVRYASPVTQRRLGFRPGDELHGAARWLVEADDPDTALRVFRAVRDTPGASERMEGRVRLVDGSWCSVEAIVTNLFDEPAIGGIVINMRDISDRKAAEQQLMWQAFHDPLTGLPNRALFLDRLAGALARSGRRGTSVAVLLLDIDRFKVVNDSLGHDAGDDLLRAVTVRIARVLRPDDAVARFGDDEFTVVCEGIDSQREPMAIAERLSTTLSAPFSVENREVFLSTSIGISVAEGSEGNPESMLRDADAAMYCAKERGRNRYELFDVALRDRAIERLETEHALHRAVELRQLRLHYQPIIDLVSGMVAGVEALVRWQHPSLGLLPPSHFIPLAEEMGLIVELGEWVLQHACWQVRRWEHVVGLPAGFAFHVNISAGQLNRPRLPKAMQKAVDTARIDPGRITLEITESAVMEDPDSAIATMRDLKALGVSLCVDDFGTGYSSLSYLKTLPIDVVKVDQAFVAGLAVDEEDGAIAEAVIALAHTLGLTAIAEGVEDERQLAELRRLGCDGAQGNYFSYPVAGVEAAELMRRRPTW
ncbi:MAG TPA: EAL domain-containing protein [Acidimicrobiales bacterium]|nr:EAL domain-containing protein [Acidimicrobiales bacterium]